MARLGSGSGSQTLDGARHSPARIMDGDRGPSPDDGMTPPLSLSPDSNGDRMERRSRGSAGSDRGSSRRRSLDSDPRWEGAHRQGQGPDPKP